MKAEAPDAFQEQLSILDPETWHGFEKSPFIAKKGNCFRKVFPASD